MTVVDYQRPNALLDLAPSVGQVALKFRWELVNKRLDHLGWIDPERDSAASITNSTTGRIFRSIQGVSLRESDWRQIDGLSEHIRPWMILEDGSEWPLGLFLIDDDHEHPHSQESTLDLDLNDLSSELDDALPYSVSIAPGGQFRPVILALAEEAGITSFDVAAFTTQAGQACNWPAGTSRLDVIRKCCEYSGQLPAYFNNQGVFVVRPSPPVEAGSARLHFEQRVLPDQTTINRGRGKAYNAFLVIGNGGGATEVVAVAYVDPALPHSRENRGRTITHVSHEQGIGDYLSALALAQQQAQADPRQYATGSFVGRVDPRSDTFDVVTANGEAWLEVGWRMDLGGSLDHSHNVVKSITNIDQISGP